MESREDNFNNCPSKRGLEILTCRTLGDLSHDPEGGTVQTVTVPGVITGWLHLMESQEDSCNNCPSKRGDIHMQDSGGPGP